MVLVVEDDEPIRKLLLRCLSSDGYEVLWADNGTRALEILVERSADLVVTDVMMAVTSKHSHREPFSIPEAIEMMKKERGKHFDPMLLDIFLGAIDQVVAIRNEHPDGDRPIATLPEDSRGHVAGCNC